MNYKGKHIVMDVVFEMSRYDNVNLANKIFSILKQSVEGKMTVVHTHLEIFGENSPEGFTACVLLDESHLTCHCYYEMGLLAFDCFTCGKTDTEAVMMEIEDNTLKLLFNGYVSAKETMQRFRY